MKNEKLNKLGNRSQKESKNNRLNTESTAKIDWMSLAKRWSTRFSEKHIEPVGEFQEWIEK